MELVIQLLIEKKIELKKDIDWFTNETNDVFLKSIIPEHKKTIKQIDKALKYLNRKHD